MYFLLLFLLTSAGRLLSKTERPITLSRNNANSIASYTFYYQISTYIPSDSLLEITFPETTYPSGLNTSSCSAINWNNVILPCSVALTTVSISVGELSNADVNNTYNLTITGILNPSIKGSSQFKLQLRRGINILDYSDFFSDIGIVPALTAIISASATCNTNCIAGQTSVYTILYTTAVDYEIYSRIYIGFPISLKLPSPIQCSSAVISNITCILNQGYVYIVLNSGKISSGTSIDIVFSSVTNPAVSGSVGSFRIFTMVPVVNTVLEEVTAIAGPLLQPNAILKLVACPGGPVSDCIGYYPYVALTNTQPYTLTITTTNPVPKGGTISITFLSNFVLRSNYCLVTSGLKNQGYTEDDQILCVVDPAARTLTITRFNDFIGGTFALKVIATNPATSGIYSSFTVNSYQDLAMTKKIDTGSLGYITVTNIPPPQTWKVSWNLPLIVNTKVQMTVIFQPKTSGLDSSTVAFKMNFPSTFAFTGTVRGYLTPHDVFPELLVTPAISGTSIQIPSATVVEPYTNSLNDENRIRVAGNTASDGILLPSMPGNYFIEMITVKSGNDIEALLWEVNVLPATMAGGAISYSYDINKNALYEISFTPTITIPQGSVPELPQYSWGTFDIRFPTMNTNLQNLWKTDLGTGFSNLDIIPCKAIQNIQPVNGDNLTCRLIPAAFIATSTYATVRVTNFQIIYLNVPVKIHIANIKNILTQDILASVTIATYQITQRIYQELNEVNFTFPRQFYLNTNPKLPKINGRSPPPYGDSLNEINFLPNTVNLPSLVTFILWTESNIIAGGNIYLKFPSVYPLTQTSISCYINYATQLPCYTYPDCGWISILNLQYTLTNHVEYTFTIRYLKNPSHQEEPASPSAVLISSGVEIEYVYFSDFKYLDLGQIYPVNVYPSSYKAINVDTKYYWIFTLTNSLPIGSSIVLSFPKKDFVLDTTPTPSCEISSILQPVDPVAGISCTISGTSIVITGFSAYTGNREVSVTILHILNPPTSRTTDYFEIETYDDSHKLVDANYIIPKIFIQTQLAVGLFKYIDFYADPSNGLAVADYTFSVMPSRSIPSGSLITIILPQNEYNSISLYQSCSVSGGLTTLDSCYGDGVNTITVVTDSDYIYSSLSSPINITVYGITNFQPMLTSGLIEIEISTSGVVINASPNSEDNRKITMGSKPSTMSLLNLTYSPTTAGERAVYNFTFNATTPFSPSCQLVIKFPKNFPRDLSEIIFCYSSEISKRSDNSVKCSTNSRTLLIYDTKGLSYSPVMQYTISIKHIRNPNAGLNGGFIFYSQCGYQMQDYGSSVFTSAFTQTPAVMYLTQGSSAGSTTLYTQEAIQLQFTTLGLFTGAAGDEIFVEFPVDYDLSFVGKGIFAGAGFNQVPSSNAVEYEPNRVKIYAFSSNVDTSTISNYTVSVVNIENPAAEQMARYLTTSIYKASTQIIYSKTYPNLNRISPFSYKKQGIEVIVNSLMAFTINIGTTIDQISMFIPSGAQTSFSVLGSISDANCILDPNPINFSIRDFTRYFSVSCSSSAVLGSHYISWTFLGTWPANYWSPIQRTILTIVDTNSDLIIVEDIGSVALGGRSLPITVSLTHSPESSLSVILYKLGTLPTNVTLTPTTLNFTKGVTKLTFTIAVDISAIGLTGKVLVTKSGTNAAYFTLAKNLLPFDIGPKDSKRPTIVDYQTLAVGRISAIFTITTDEPCDLYWMVGRYGTRPPTVSEVINGTLDDVEGLHDSPIFGFNFNYTQLESNRYFYTLSISGLIAQTNYTLHVFARDTGGNTAVFIPTIQFITLPRYRIATFPIYFTTNVSGSVINSTLIKIADILDISHQLVINRTDYSGSTGTAASSSPYQTDEYTSSSGLGRLLTNVVKVDVLILPDPSQDLRPLDLVNSLQDHKAELGQVQGINVSYTISGQEIYGVVPVFRSRPRLGSVLGGVLTLIDLSLFYDGFISICVIVYNQSEYLEPIAYQVNNMLGPINYGCNMSQVIPATPIPTQAFFEGIQAGTEYRVLICAFNKLQVYPDYMWHVEVIKFTTYGMADSSNNSSALYLIVYGLVLSIV